MSNTAILGGVAVFIGLTIIIGLWAAKQIEGDSVNYIVAGRTLILPLVAATLMAQSLDANATLGNTDLTSDFGFWAGAALPIGLALCLIVCGLFFAKPLNKMRLITMPDFFRKRYGRKTEILASIVTVMSFGLLLAGNLVAGGLLFQIFLGVDYIVGVAMIATIILLYTLAGGLFAVAYTDIIQAGIALVGSVALLAYVGVNYGFTIPAGAGPSNIGQLTNVTEPSSGAMINLATITALAFGNLVALDFNERLYAAKDPATARLACFAAAAGTLIIGIPFSIVALGASDILASVGAAAGDNAILYVLVQEALPAWLGVVVIVGIVGASLSTGDGAILATSSVIARNVIGIRPEADTEGPIKQDKLLLVTRVVAVGIATLGSLIAVRDPQTGMLLVLAFDLSLAGVAVPFVFGLFWSKSTREAALSAIVVGVVSRLVFFFLSPTTYGLPNNLLYIDNSLITPAFDGFPTFISPLLAIGTFVVVALVTAESEADSDTPAAQPGVFTEAND
jgi:SSS family solute:Na+ symporter